MNVLSGDIGGFPGAEAELGPPYFNKPFKLMVACVFSLGLWAGLIELALALWGWLVA